MKKTKQTFINAFKKAAQEHTHNYSRWDSEAQSSIEVPFSYPVPAGKYTIDENYGKKEICIRCKKCWTEDLLIIARKVVPKFRAKVSGYLSVSGFGTAYNFFTIHFY